MKKFTSLMLMLLVAVTTWAQTSYETSTAENPKWYTIGSYDRGGYLTNVGVGTGVKHVDIVAGSLWYFEVAEDGGVYLVNAVKDNGENVYLGADLTASKTPAVWYILSNGVNEFGMSISKTSQISNYSCVDANNHNDGVGTWHASANDWKGTTWVIELVTDFSSVIDVPAAKTAAIATLDNIKNVTVLFDAGIIEEVKTDVNNVEAKSNSLEDLNAAIESINAIVATVYTENFTTKNVRFTTDARGNGVDITAVDAGAAEQHNSGDAGIWTLKAVNGGFKMYNFVSNLWMGATKGQSQRIPTVANEEEAALYIVNSNEGNKINLMNNGNTLHANGWGNIVQWNDNNAGASIFLVAAEPEIAVARDIYVNANAAKANLPYAIQKAYGLVKDASNYYSNYKSTAEGSYEALLDNAEGSYFHSAYGSEPGDGSGVHYIQANLGDGNSVDEFYFYMKPRSGNGNNRPVNITVAGSNDNIEYTKIADVKTTLDGSMTPYVSAKLGTDGTNYQYIRLTVTSTNTSTTFFTLSELYFFPATSDVENLVNAYSGLATTSITSNDYATYANALVNAETTLALANIKKEIAAILTTNATNHAEEPALGQYTTAAYNALTAANADANATQESLEAAIVAFNKAKNLPVFTIDGVISYAAGKSVYDDNDGAPNFKATNKYDKTMWWVFDQTETTVGVTESVDVVNYATGNGFWGAKSLKITETSDADEDDGIFLFYTVGNDTPLHYQDANQVIVRWGSKDSGSGSATKFSYLGNTYELDQLTGEKIDALADLQAAYNAKAVYANAVIGDGLGQYKGNKDAVVAALEAAEVIGSKTLAQQATLNIIDINAAATALNSAAALEINMPVEGKYYRIQGACEASPANHYITGHTNADGGRIALTAEADASTIFYFTNGNLVAYQSGLVIGLNNSNWTFASIDDNSKPASTITFEASPRTAGAYLVKSANVYMHYKTYEGAAEIDRCSSDAGHANHDWYLTEVEALPVTISGVKHATFFAPVAVTVPEGVTAHTVTVDGEWAVMTEIKGGVIPANTGVILTGEATDYSFEITTADAFEGENLMVGTIAKTLVAKAENTECYVLANDSEKGLGMYAAVNREDATKFYNAGHKAYLAVEGVQGVKSYSFRFGEGTTGIGEVKGENGEVKVIYDLTGRRIEAITAPGIYIVGGKKVLVK